MAALKGVLDRKIPFRRALLAWYESSRRDLPWRQSGDFYRVWISEIMLQQTRVEAVIPYYRRFLERFPTVQALAAAGEDDVLAAWSGLGYYSRARNLHRAARQIAVRQLAGRGAPSTYEEIQGLAGVGAYTSAAVASIVLGLPHAAVDGNVVRVVSRLTNDAAESSSPAARRAFGQTAQSLLDPGRPGDFNQAMMELGATVCKPRLPACGECPVRGFCAARAAGTERALPVRLKREQTRDLVLDLIVLRRAREVFLVQRPAAERRLAGFWELPEKKSLAGHGTVLEREFTHQIVHDRFRVRVWALPPGEVSPLSSWPELAGSWLAEERLADLPLATTARKALSAGIPG